MKQYSHIILLIALLVMTVSPLVAQGQDNVEAILGSFSYDIQMIAQLEINDLVPQEGAFWLFQGILTNHADERMCFSDEEIRIFVYSPYVSVARPHSDAMGSLRSALNMDYPGRFGPCLAPNETHPLFIVFDMPEQALSLQLRYRGRPTARISVSQGADATIPLSEQDQRPGKATTFVIENQIEMPILGSFEFGDLRFYLEQFQLVQRNPESLAVGLVRSSPKVSVKVGGRGMA